MLYTVGVLSVTPSFRCSGGPALPASCVRVLGWRVNPVGCLELDRMREVGLLTSHPLSHWTPSSSLFLEAPLYFQLLQNSEVTWKSGFSPEGCGLDL